MGPRRMDEGPPMRRSSGSSSRSTEQIRAMVVDKASFRKRFDEPIYPTRTGRVNVRAPHGMNEFARLAWMMAAAALVGACSTAPPAPPPAPPPEPLPLPAVAAPPEPLPLPASEGWT